MASSRLPELFRAAFVIARRDFTATVLRKTFLLFLIGPLFPVVMGFGFGGMGAKLEEESARPAVAVVSSPAEFAPLVAARDRLEAVTESPIVDLVRVPHEVDVAAQRTRLLSQKSPPILAVLETGAAGPHLTGDIHADGRTVAQLDYILNDARLEAARGEPKPSIAVTPTKKSGGTLASARTLTARGGQTILFLLTILLAGAVLSQLIEEKSNKAIEILAAAVPVEAIFIGKLFAMLAISFVGIAVWTATGALAIAAWASGGLAGLPAPAVGWPLFLALTVVYFSMAYLLIGSVFLAIGSQASSVREIQTLNMPVVLAQSAIYFFGASAVGHLDEPRGLAAAIFPLSSPFAMIARAAEQDLLWPHLAAIAWQAIWVALILRAGAGLFRRNVLKSGKAQRWPWQRAKAAGA